MNETKMEFAVEMRDENCIPAIRKALIGMGELEIDANKGRVVLHTQTPWSLALEQIEKTGRKAVLVGFGGESAVTIITPSGNILDRSSVQGVVRYSSIRNDNQPGLVVDGVVDGLRPGSYSLHIHETGDTSAGCDSLGERYWPNGCPTTAHHKVVGDIQADANGRATFRYIDPAFRMSEIVGRSVIIKSSPSQMSSDDNRSEDRIACGIIARSAGIMQNFKKFCACDGVTLWDERLKPIAGGNRNQLQ